MELLTVQETAKMLRITRKTLYKLIKNGEIPAIRLGTHWRIPKEELEKLIANSNSKNKKEE